MAIASMTAFSEHRFSTAFGEMTWELRSLNHRYLDLVVRLPDPLRRFDTDCRRHISAMLSRGKVEASLVAVSSDQLLGEAQLDEAAVVQFFQQCRQLKQHGEVGVQAIDVLRWPGVLQRQPQDVALISEPLLSALTTALQQLVVVRQSEGGGVSEFFAAELASMRALVSAASARLPVVLADIDQKIRVRFDELALTVEPERLSQEILWYTQKLNVAEELQRLNAHLDAVSELLDTGGVVGRRLDFIMQELNREANTLASKSSDSIMTSQAVAMKVHIEQMREQVQNIE